MKAHWWNCVLGLLCMPANVMLSTWTVSQDPSSISLRVNSSAKITCSTSLPEPMGLSLKRAFHDKRDIVFLSLKNGLVTKYTIVEEFVGRINVAPDQQIRAGYGFTLQLSLLGQEDTDLYYCSWIYFKSETANIETLPSNGTIIIVKERDPQEQCRDHIWDLILIAFSVTALIVLSFLFAGVIVRCKRFKKNFRPARAVKPPRVNRPQHVCVCQQCPYLDTYVNNPTLDFRGILYC
ncbi:hypothetical protein PFLUV_G00247470 [Perca fluviatilis]|uniref:Immunoglobulin V-set domain-containing protein n=1 Tax=Perca fluviatilis TaxID=8168 RepID=A0A6A5E6G3_PERFL|nr:uncharacterized protein LOC120551322 isoform X1 [Perca fluviatilis]XP_039644576.1 uncharacterized protein LOC120551322 isoform X1 [Perca fluviatilis]XP_039644577.1 uncharacterized protein LOC120551322 isoform X1 [Perca fluviatilis]KAF1374228.1 hypothetical protein PFLUV_G00247470 [Perca fluviatilis]